MLTKTENYSLEELNQIGEAMQKSGFFSDIKSASQALVKILAGQEMGFSPFASINGIHIIENKPTISANLMAAAIKRSIKYNYNIKDLSAEKAEIEFIEMRNNKFETIGISEFTIRDAAKAGLLNKNNWKKYPKNMLFTRAISNGIKWYCPDVMNGNVVYTQDELGKEKAETIMECCQEIDNNIEQNHAETETLKLEASEEEIKAARDNFDRLTEALEQKILKTVTVEELEELYKKSDSGSREWVLPEFKKQKKHITGEPQRGDPFRTD